MITLAQKKYRRTYHTTLFSIPHIFYLMVCVLMIGLPAFLGSYQKYLWRYNFTVVSAPIIKYNDNFVLIVYKADGTKKYFSSLEKYNNQIAPSELISAVTYKTSILDQNNDLNPDVLKLTVEIEEEGIVSADLNIFLDYTFSESIFISFTDVVSFKGRLASGTKNKIFGYFDVEQLESYNNIARNITQYSYNLWNDFKTDFNLEAVKRAKLQKKFKLTKKTQSMVEEVHPGSAVFDIEIILNNLNSLNYIPNFIQLFNRIWIIYFSLFIPLYYMGKCVLAAVFKYKLFATRLRLRIGDFVLNTNN